MSRALAAIRRAWRAAACFVLACASGIVEDEASLRSSSLAFSLIFCAAPMGAMLLGASSLFPKAFSFWPALYAKIGPRVLPSALDEAAAALSAFSANAENLSLISMALAAGSALLLSMQVEKCVQACWGPPPCAPERSNPLARHWLALTLTPCAAALLGAAAYEALSFSPDVGAAWTPAALLFFFFLVCAWALPAGRPPLGAACAAAAMASLECMAIQSGFGLFWAKSQSYGAIYGAAAVFLGALLWVWLFWLSLLTSVSICSTALLRRPRDLRASGLDLASIHLGLGANPPCFAPKGLRAGSAASSPEPGAPCPPQVALGGPLAERLAEALAADPALADPRAYEAALAGRAGLAPKLEALGAACCAKAAADLLADGLGRKALAKPPGGSTIPNAAAGEPSPTPPAGATKTDPP